MADKKPTKWDSKNPPVGNYGTIVDKRLTTITPDNTTGYVKLSTTSTDEIVNTLYYSIDVNGKVTYAFGDDKGVILVDGKPTKQFNNIQEIADSNYIGYSDATTKKIKDSLATNLNQRTKDILIEKTEDPSPYATTPDSQSNVPETVDFLNDTFDSNARPLDANFLKGPYWYPEAIRSNGQDYIQFTLIEYGTKTVNTQNPDNVTDLFKLSSRTKSENAVGSVFLPIQQGISDQSMVSWADENMSPLAMALMQSAANPESIGGNAESIAQKIIGNSDYQKMIQQQIYGAAAGVNPLARLSGLVINPNLELLFNGPSLRPFNFTFRLSPRTKNEAKHVKDIIRWFKQGSVVRTTTDNLFLKAPNVFKIQYVYGEDKQNENNPTHPGLNKIKTCALRSMNVNYNPDGSYMTFQDGTMTSYEMTLQFSELEPVYDIDYDSSKGKNEIGY